MKTIVTHFSPDVDAMCSVWLVKKFMPGFSGAETTFVPAGKTLFDKKVDADCDVVHVDTGFGRFDHHQDNRNTCASKLVFEYLVKNKLVRESQEKALKRMVGIINEIDHFRQIYWPQATNDRYEFSLDGIVDGVRLLYPRESAKMLELGLEMLEAIFRQFSNKVWAEDIIKKEGKEFSSPWGKALGLDTTNDEAVHLAQKMGYSIVVRKDPRKDYVRIKGVPGKKIDFTKLYEILKDKDKSATWFLHASKHMVLNGSTKNPEMKPTKLSLEEIIKIIKSL